MTNHSSRRSLPRVPRSTWSTGFLARTLLLGLMAATPSFGCFRSHELPATDESDHSDDGSMVPSSAADAGSDSEESDSGALPGEDGDTETGDVWRNRRPCEPDNPLWVDGTDPSCGGHAPCFPSIQAAVDSADEGAMVWVRPGTYLPEPDARYVVDARERLVCVRSTDGPERTVLDGDSRGSTVVSGYRGALWLEGFTVRGSGRQDADVINGWGVAVGSWSECRAWIVGNILEFNELGTGAVRVGLGEYGASVDLLFASNVVRHNRPMDRGSVIRIEGNSPDSHARGTVRIENNLIHHNQGVGIVFGEWIRFHSAEIAPTSFEVVNNTFAENVGATFAPVDGIHIHNNIFHKNSDGAIIQPEIPAAPSIKANLFETSDEPWVGRDQNTSGSPLFVDDENEDFRLRPESPAVRAGTPELAPSRDITGQLRRDGQPDIGAYSRR